MFWSNFQQLCIKNGKFPNNVCSDLGFSSATASVWKRGSVPRETTLKKIAEYFGVTVEELLQDNTNSDITEIQIAYEKAPDYIKRAVRKLLDLPSDDKQEFHFITMLEVPTPTKEESVPVSSDNTPS